MRTVTIHETVWIWIHCLTVFIGDLFLLNFIWNNKLYTRTWINNLILTKILSNLSQTCIYLHIIVSHGVFASQTMTLLNLNFKELVVKSLDFNDNNGTHTCTYVHRIVHQKTFRVIFSINNYWIAISHFL